MRRCCSWEQSRGGGSVLGWGEVVRWHRSWAWREKGGRWQLQVVSFPSGWWCGLGSRQEKDRPQLKSLFRHHQLGDFGQMTPVHDNSTAYEG